MVSHAMTEREPVTFPLRVTKKGSCVMAKVVFGDGRQMSGSLGASTYMRDGRVRRRTNPVNTVTARKTEKQGNFAMLSARWKALTEDERLSWIGALTRINSLGAAITLGAFQAYMAVNAVRLVVGLALTDTPPAFDSDSGLTIVGGHAYATATEDDREFKVEVSSHTGGTRSIIIEATRPISPGITNFVNQLRFIDGGVVDGGGDALLDMTIPYVDAFGIEALNAGALGRKVGVRIRDANNGNPLFVGTLGLIAIAPPGP